MRSGWSIFPTGRHSRGLVSREEALLLDRMREGDNPWIVKYMFK